jgi:subtilisin family serine protease
MFDKLSLETDVFSWKKALTLGMASLLAYQKNADGLVHVATKTWGFQECKPFGVGETQGFVAWDEKIVLASFRGTESVGDWLSNLDLLSAKRSYGKLHRGFLQSFEIARLIVTGFLKDATAEDKKVWLTGHSLGGALAMIAAAELIDSLSTSGIYTYGQPKTGDNAVRQFFQLKFAGKFHRFVNDDDVVPQVPPHYVHVGRLIWFDGDGNLKRSDEPMEATEADVPSRDTQPQPHEMSEAEFKEFQRELKEIKLVTGGESEVFERSVEGIFPSVADHDLGRYVSILRRHAATGVELDEVLEEAIELKVAAEMGVETTTRSRLRSPNGQPILLRVKNANWTPPAEIAVQSRLGTIVTARCSLSQIEQLRQDRDVVSIEVSREGGIAELATSIPFVQATQVHAPPLDERGELSIVAIIDTGVDVLHEAFRDAAGKTRILALWGQKASPDGAAPNAVDATTYTQDYGRLYQAADIQQMIDGQSQTPLALRDPQKHGTHVASIAAGRSAGAFAGGMAPKSKIVVVIPDMVTSPGDPPSIGYSNSHVDALSFVRATAEKSALPVAVNVSLGMNAGAHDGSSTLEAGFDQFSGVGRDPGFIVIKSAGNERGHKGHAATAAMLGGISQIVWDSEHSLRDLDYIEVWFNSFDDIAFTLIDPANNRSGTVSASHPKEVAILGGNQCQLRLTPLHRDNGDNLLLVNIMPDSQMIQAGRWRLEMQGLSLPSGGEIHAWVERDNSRAVNFASGDNDEMMLSIPGTARTVITVAACESAIPLRLTDSSSWGLTRDRRPKPDLCAPGKDISAARANTNDPQAVVSSTGTSMAAPHVTGAVALLLSRLHKSGKPQVNAQQVQRALIRSAQNFTGQHNKGFGYGALNVLAFINQF